MLNSVAAFQCLFKDARSPPKQLTLKLNCKISNILFNISKSREKPSRFMVTKSIAQWQHKVEFI